MPDDQSEAIGIIGALSDAGLLRTAASGTRGSPSASGAMGIIAALGEAGVLATPADASATAGPPAQPGWGPKVGDVVRAAEIVQVTKVYEDGGKLVQFLSLQALRPSRFWQVVCEFPPNDNSYLAELDKALASSKPTGLSIQVEVTRRIYEDARTSYFDATLKDLRVGYRIPDLPPWTYG
jgi:hypothetical protein